MVQIKMSRRDPISRPDLIVPVHGPRLAVEFDNKLRVAMRPAQPALPVRPKRSPEDGPKRFCES